MLARHMGAVLRLRANALCCVSTGTGVEAPVCSYCACYTCCWSSAAGAVCLLLMTGEQSGAFLQPQLSATELATGSLLHCRRLAVSQP